MRYRIVQTGEGFVIQRKRFGLFWINHKQHHFTVSSYNSNCVYDGKRNVVYNSLEDAMSKLNEIKKYPLKFMGHRIYYGIQTNNEPVYVDDHSCCGLDGLDRALYKIYANNVEEVKEKVKKKIKLKKDKDNKRKEAILMEKKNKEIINIWYED